MTKRTQRAPAKRAIIVGMDGASMELVKNMIDWGHAPSMAKLLQTGVYRPMIGVFPTLTPPAGQHFLRVHGPAHIKSWILISAPSGSDSIKQYGVSIPGCANPNTSGTSSNAQAGNRSW